MAKNGLVQPATLKIGSKQFEKLQAEWYRRAADFNGTTDTGDAIGDIEWATNPNSPYLQRSGGKARMLTPGKQLYYALCRNYLTHGGLKGRKKFAWQHHTDGLSYRKILGLMQRKYGIKRSVYWVFYFVEAIKEKMLAWNRTHPEGMLNPANQDSFAEDALLGDFGLAIAQPYELARPKED